jgi:hypothetical protein
MIFLEVIPIHQSDRALQRRIGDLGMDRDARGGLNMYEPSVRGVGCRHAEEEGSNERDGAQREES